MTKMPRGAKLIKNPLTIAPGFYINNVYVLPGVPIIMQKMFDSLVKTLNSSKPIISRNINTNLYESTIAKTLTKFQKKYKSCEIGSYPHFDSKKKPGNVNVVITGKNKSILEDIQKETEDMIKNNQ